MVTEIMSNIKRAKEGEKLTERISLYTTKSQNERIAEWMRRRRTGESDIIRRLLDMALNHLREHPEDEIKL